MIMTYADYATNHGTTSYTYNDITYGGTFTITSTNASAWTEVTNGDSCFYEGRKFNSEKEVELYKNKIRGYQVIKMLARLSHKVPTICDSTRVNRLLKIPEGLTYKQKRRNRINKTILI